MSVVGIVGVIEDTPSEGVFFCVFVLKKICRETRAMQK